LKFDLDHPATSGVTKPTKEISRTASAEAEMLNYRSKLVVVQFDVPFTTMVAPGRGPSSLVSVTETD